MTSDAPNVPSVQGAREARYAEAIKGHAWHDYDGECACGWFPTEGQRGSSVDLWASHIAPLLAPLVDAEVAAAVSEAQAEVVHWQQKLKRRGVIINDLRKELTKAQAAAAEYLSMLDGETVMAIMDRDRALLAPSPAATTGEARPRRLGALRKAIETGQPADFSGYAPAPVSSDSTDIPTSDAEPTFEGEDSQIIAPVSSGEAGTGEAAKPEWWDADHDRPADVYTPPERTYCHVCGVGYTMHVDSLCKRSESRGIRSPRPAPVVTPSAEGSE